MARPDTIAFVDVETTGLDPTKSDPIEIAVVTVDAKTLEKISTFECKMMPRSWRVFEPEALAINGYSESEWIKCGAGQVWIGIESAVKVIGRSTFAGHNPWFDASFINEHIDFKPHGHHMLDTCSMALPLLIAGRIESLSLDSLCAYFGIERPKIHRALPDALAELQVCRNLTQLYMDGLP